MSRRQRAQPITTPMKMIPAQFAAVVGWKPTIVHRRTVSPPSVPGPVPQPRRADAPQESPNAGAWLCRRLLTPSGSSHAVRRWLLAWLLIASWISAGTGHAQTLLNIDFGVGSQS